MIVERLISLKCALLAGTASGPPLQQPAVLSVPAFLPAAAHLLVVQQRADLFRSFVLLLRDDAIAFLRHGKLGHLPNAREISNCLNEVRILASITNPYIIGYKEVIYDEGAGCLLLITEFGKTVSPAPLQGVARAAAGTTCKA
jgi:hypothetical protein